MPPGAVSWKPNALAAANPVVLVAVVGCRGRVGCRSPQSPAQVSEVFCTAAFDVPISPLAVTWVADNVDTLPVVRSAAAWRSVSLPHGDADVRYRDFGRLGEGLKVGDVGALRTTGISAASTSNASCADAAPISTRCVSPLLRLTSRSASRGT